MKYLLGFVIVTSLAFGRGHYTEGRDFPMGPDESMTPGSLCQDADYFRYAERIAYCERDVEKELKADIIREYDRRLGYSIGEMERSDFKIDHYIPLCMGGSNRRDNLWPQHKTVFDQTDMIEQRSCELMAQGKLKQTEAVRLIKHVKNHLEEAERVLADLDNRFRR